MICCGEHHLLSDTLTYTTFFFSSLSLCSFRFEYRHGGHCLRCFSRKNKIKRKSVYRYSPSKSFVIIYVYVFSLFSLCLLLFSEELNSFLILSCALHSLSGGYLLFEHHLSCFFFDFVVAKRFFEKKKTSITFHVVI